MKKFLLLSIAVFSFSYGNCITISSEHYNYGQHIPAYKTVEKICPSSSVKSFYTKTDKGNGFIKLNLNSSGCINIDKTHFKEGQKVPDYTMKEKICR